MATTEEKHAKVVTQDPSAQGAIELLRRVAVVLEEHIAHLEADLETEREKTGSVEELEDLLRDFRRGIVDKDELIDRTVGQYD